MSYMHVTNRCLLTYLIPLGNGQLRELRRNDVEVDDHSIFEDDGIGRMESEGCFLGEFVVSPRFRKGITPVENNLAFLSLGNWILS